MNSACMWEAHKGMDLGHVDAGMRPRPSTDDDDSQCHS